MAVSIHERFENHIDTASPETSGDAKRETDTEEDPYDKGFEEKLTLARIKGAEQQDSGIEKNEEDDSPQKRRMWTKQKLPSGAHWHGRCWPALPQIMR